MASSRGRSPHSPLAYRGPDGGVGSAEWEKSRPNTKKAYPLYIDRIVDKWGPLPVASVTARDIYAFRELHADTPSLANQLVKMLRTLIAFGIPRGYIDRKPAAEVTPIPIVDVEHARPWPEDAYKRVIETAPRAYPARCIPWSHNRPKAFRFGAIR